MHFVVSLYFVYTFNKLRAPLYKTLLCVSNTTVLKNTIFVSDRLQKLYRLFIYNCNNFVTRFWKLRGYFHFIFSTLFQFSRQKKGVFIIYSKAFLPRKSYKVFKVICSLLTMARGNKIVDDD